MSKDKKRMSEEENQEETVFYFDIVGSILIILSLISLGRLGSGGNILYKLFKITFGDFYWIIILFIIIYGFYLLFFHNKIDFKNSKIIGIIIITISLLVFSHFSLFNYLQTYGNDKSYFSLIISYYKDYFNNHNIEYLGGGLIGGTIFYILFSIVGKMGTIIICLILILLGLSLIINRPILSIISNGASKFKNIKKYIKNFNRFFKYELSNDSKKEKKIVINEKKVPIKFLNDLNNELIFNMQQSSSLEIKNTIKTILKNYNLSFDEKDIIISYNVTTYNFFIYDSISIDYVNDIVNKITEIIDYNLLYSFYNEGKYNHLIIQIVNEYDISLNLKSLLLKANHNQNNIIPIGICYDNTVFTYNSHSQSTFLIIGDNNVGIKTYLFQHIIKLLIKEGLKKYEFYVFDSLKHFYLFKDIVNIYYNLEEMFNDINNIIEERLNEFKKLNVLNYEEYLNYNEANETNAETFKRIIIIIDELVDDSTNFIYFENKLIYINQLSKKVGIEINYVIRDLKYITNSIISSFELRLLFKSSKQLSEKIINNENGYYLKPNGDIIISEKNSGVRIQTPLITVEEINNILKFIIKN